MLASRRRHTSRHRRMFGWVELLESRRLLAGDVAADLGDNSGAGVPNNPPVAVGDIYTVAEDQNLIVLGSGVLVNDADSDGDALTATLVTPPVRGTVILNSNGTFIYTPAPNFNGIDSFAYRASDGVVSSNVATVILNISPVNDAPVASGDSYSVAQNGSLTVAAPGLLGNDSDVEGNPLAAILVAGPAHGTLTLHGNGAFTYTPAAGYDGPDSFTYRASDGALSSNVATVSLTVLPTSNDAPIAADDSYDVAEDGSLTVAAPGVLGNDTDGDGDPLSAELVSGPAHGVLTFNPNGSFTYTAAAGYHGADSFTYRATDGIADSNVATVHLDVLGAEDQLQELLDDLAALKDSGDINDGQFHSLSNKLLAAIDRLNDDRTAQGIKKIEDFIDEVERLMSKSALTTSVGEALIDAAEAAIAAAG